MKKLAFILPFLFVFAPLFAQAALTDNIVAYWKFDENTGSAASDATGNGNTGTFAGSPALTWATGKIGFALNFNGNEQAISIANSSSIQTINTSGSATVSMWIKRLGDNPSSSLYDVLLYKGPWGGNDNESTAFGIYGNFGGSHKITLQIGTKHASYQGATTINNNIWYHVVAVINGSANTVDIYVNGNNDLHTTLVNPISLDTNALLLADVSDRSYDWNGTIDEVGIWSRALSSTEIAQLYNSGAGLQYPFATAPARKMRLFEGFKIKLISGKMILE